MNIAPTIETKPTIFGVRQLGKELAPADRLGVDSVVISSDGVKFELLGVGFLGDDLLRVGLLEIGLLQVVLLEIGLLRVGLLEIGLRGVASLWVGLVEFGSSHNPMLGWQVASFGHLLQGAPAS